MRREERSSGVGRGGEVRRGGLRREQVEERWGEESSTVVYFSWCRGDIKFSCRFLDQQYIFPLVARFRG